MSALGEGPRLVGIDTARMLPEGDASGVARDAKRGGDGSMSALGEGPHLVGVDTARMLPDGDASGVANRSTVCEPEA